MTSAAAGETLPIAPGYAVHVPASEAVSLAGERTAFRSTVGMEVASRFPAEPPRPNPPI
ncbi:hypothetical protein [Streptomyces roseoviridis]|uniref:Uncharacterized protein n=1 Tax=Streptomyces roseoviridis TaxID=67361 RepID=A0ABV5QYM8_9ACTN